MDPRLTYIVKHKRPQVNTQPREWRGIFCLTTVQRRQTGTATWYRATVSLRFAFRAQCRDR